ncbi:oligosaccharide flippase family protein [Candidatus Berkelbacteria bacterium]|nr:oligosaccharide flippase family protein [Candidatus Berkelbacteria bacterium]
MSFVRSVGWTFLAKGTVFFLGVLSSIIVARFLGPHDKGVLAAVTALAGIALQVGNLGLPNANTYFLAKDRSLLPKILGHSVWASMVLGGIMAGAASVAAWAWPSIVGDVPRPILLIGLASVPFMFFTSLAQNILLALRRIRTYNLLDVGSNVVATGVSILLVVLWQVGADALIVAGTVIAVGVTLAHFRAVRALPARRPDPSLFRLMFRYGLRAYAATLLAYLVIRSDLLLVTHFLGNEATGVYSIAAFAVDALYLVAITTGTLFFPIATAEPERRDLLTAQVVRTLVVIMAAILLVGGLAAYWLIPLLYGTAFAGAVAPTLILLPGIYFLSLETILMNNFAARGLPITAVGIVGLGLGVNLLLNLAFIPTLGIGGAALASVAAYGVMLALSLLYFRSLSATPLAAVLVPRRSDLVQLWRQVSRSQE